MCQQSDGGARLVFSLSKETSTLSTRMSQATSQALACSFNRTNVKSFSDNFKTVLDRLKIESCDIWNVNETNVTAVQRPDEVSKVSNKLDESPPQNEDFSLL
ncbi:hypothetical protein JTB14_017674 [Gonioctena quinquepunctata]|nr:hypothetical protein JTB14_017674 [Gonioctena quinquepunctata]